MHAQRAAVVAPRAHDEIEPAARPRRAAPGRNAALEQELTPRPHGSVLPEDLPPRYLSVAEVHLSLWCAVPWISELYQVKP
ncbi:hypothetical protein [Sorangium sp. So ce131]|uniref:hypothetical protein n=1 Tax=Sorangium sp. So ce131 TaxID=3133282 RepID=UPI003F609F15